MSLVPKRDSAAALREDSVNALRMANALLEPYLKQAGFFEKPYLARNTRDAVLDTQLEGFLKRLEAFNQHVLAEDQAFYSEQLFADLAERTKRILKILQDLGTTDNVFAAKAAQDLFEIWMRGTERLLAAHGF